MVILTARQLAEMCDCTVATINRKAPQIGGRTVGRGGVFSEDSVAAWLNTAPRKTGRPRRKRAGL
jgi:hypothetical protein